VRTVMLADEYPFVMLAQASSSAAPRLVVCLQFLALL